MLSGGTIITTTIMSRLILNRKIHRHHALGCSFAIIGFAIVGLSSVLNGKSEEKYSLFGLILGIIMIMISLVTQGGLANYEEWLIGKYEIDVQRMVGIEGFFGIIWIFTWIMVFCMIPCPDDHLCDVNLNSIIRLEDIWKIQ